MDNVDRINLEELLEWAQSVWATIEFGPNKSVVVCILGPNQGSEECFRGTNLIDTLRKAREYKWTENGVRP